MKINDRVKLSELGLAIRKGDWSKRLGVIASQPKVSSPCVAVRWDGNKQNEYISRSFLRVIPWACKACGKVSDMPMIRDELWLTVATPKEFMCLECFEQGIGRMITLDDLKPCLWTDILLKLVNRAKRGQL